jgi:CheY-like chemotaxis protein
MKHVTPKGRGRGPAGLALKGKRVLVVEDEFFIADEIALLLQQLGAEVVGPISTLEAVLKLLERDGPPLDFAILDIKLRGAEVYPAADILSARGVPFVFSTGYDNKVLPPRFADVGVWSKPVDSARLRMSIEVQRPASQ